MFGKVDFKIDECHLQSLLTGTIKDR